MGIVCRYTVLHLLDGCFSWVQVRHEVCDVSHDGLVPCLDHDPQPVALDDAGGEEDHVPGLQDVGVALLRANGHSLALPSLLIKKENIVLKEWGISAKEIQILYHLGNNIIWATKIHANICVRTKMTLYYWYFTKAPSALFISNLLQVRFIEGSAPAIFGWYPEWFFS